LQAINRTYDRILSFKFQSKSETEFSKAGHSRQSDLILQSTRIWQQ